MRGVRDCADRRPFVAVKVALVERVEIVHTNARAQCAHAWPTLEA
jgi:hypothetical protein